MSLERKKSEIYKQYGISKIKKLAMHDDADGLASGVLLTLVFKTEGVFCPKEFGRWPIVPMGGEIPPDVCCDMIPHNPKWKGLAFDHHPGHLEESKRNYKLVWGPVPATLVIYKLFKEVIPPEHKWKVAVGLVGDGQPELIPPEIWRNYPSLLEYHASVWEKYGKLDFGNFPVYLKLSAPINAACKIPDKWYLAYQVLRNARSPYDILEDKPLLAAKRVVKEETDRIIRETSAINLKQWFRVWRIASKYRIERTLAWRSEQRSHITTLVINEETKRCSMRGAMSELICQFLDRNGFHIHGHPGFSGGTIAPSQTVEEMYKVLQKLKI